MTNGIIVIAVAAMILLKLYIVGSMPQQQVARQQTQQVAYQANTVLADDIRTRFAIDLAHRLGNPNPSADTIAFIVDWTIAEDSGSGAFDRMNPLNSTEKTGSTGFILNGDGVTAYPTFEAGLDATVITIANGYYPHILHGIQTNSVEEALDDTELGIWGTGRGNVANLYYKGGE
jgi:hypothetical protein